MFKDDKWLNYSVKILVAIDEGFDSIQKIAEEIDESPSYTAKVIAELRNRGIFDKKYILDRPLDQIFVKDVLDYSPDASYLSTDAYNLLFDHQSITIEQLANLS